MPVVSNTQDPDGPARIGYGFVARGASAREAVALSATTEVADIIGVLHRNEARSLAELPAQRVPELDQRWRDEVLR